MTNVLIKSRNLDIGTCRGKVVCRQRGRIAIGKPRTEIWKRSFPHSPGKEPTLADTLILEFWLLEVGENTLPLFESPRLWHFAGTALEN